MKGRIDRRDDQAKFIAMEVKRPELVHRATGPPVRLKVPASRLTETLVAEIKRILEAHPGESAGAAPRGGRAPHHRPAPRPGLLRRRRQRAPRRAAGPAGRRRRLLTGRAAYGTYCSQISSTEPPVNVSRSGNRDSVSVPSALDRGQVRLQFVEGGFLEFGKLVSGLASSTWTPSLTVAERFWALSFTM